LFELRCYIVWWFGAALLLFEEILETESFPPPQTSVFEAAAEDKK
jgi:hypothetical protein